MNRLPPWFTRLAQAVVLAALAYLLWRTVDWAEAWTLLSGAHPGLLLSAAAFLTLQTLLSALRWRLTAARLGITLPLRQAIGEYYLGQVVNQSLPGGIVGDAGRAIRARNQAGLLISGQAVLFERIAGQIGCSRSFSRPSHSTPCTRLASIGPKASRSPFGSPSPAPLAPLCSPTPPAAAPSGVVSPASVTRSSHRPFFDPGRA